MALSSPWGPPSGPGAPHHCHMGWAFLIPRCRGDWAEPRCGPNALLVAAKAFAWVVASLGCVGLVTEPVC